jgi:hypothetical protein
MPWINTIGGKEKLTMPRGLLSVSKKVCILRIHANMLSLKLALGGSFLDASSSDAI